jgi:mono/diheme cytochrome c family protein
MDHWVFPVGTMVFKEFRLDGKLLETRLVARLGLNPDDYFMGAFRWYDDESDAVFVRDGGNDVRETGHDIPAVKKCFTCHNGDRGRVLGYSAVQQPAAKAALSDPPAEPYVVPGDAIAREALGYLHANCGNCHNPTGTSRTDTNLTLRLEVAERAVEDTGIYRTSVRIDLDRWLHNGFDLRIAPADPDRSAVLARMKTRNKDDAMPPFASEQVDTDGIELVRKWIESL